MRKFLLLGWFCSLVACSLLASRPPEHPQVTALISGPPSISVVIDGPQSLTVCDIIPIRYVLNPFQEQLQVADTVVFRHPTSAVSQDVYVPYKPRSWVIIDRKSDVLTQKFRKIEQKPSISHPFGSTGGLARWCGYAHGLQFWGDDPRGGTGLS